MLAPQAVKKPILSRKELVALIASSMVLGSVPILCQLLLASPIDRRVSLLINQLMIMGIGMSFLIGVVIVIGSLIVLLFKRGRRQASRVLVICLCSAVFMLGGVLFSSVIRTKQFEDLADRSRPLIAAIALFEKDHGRPPAKLELLVPKYINEIPNTGMGAYPKYEYKVSSTEPGPDHLAASWELSVPCSVGILNWDVFYYLPTEKYPKHDYGGYIEPIKNWAYVHE